MDIIKTSLCILIIGMLTACGAPSFKGSSVELESKPNVIIIEDNATKKGFLVAVKKWLALNDYQYTVQPEGSNHD